MTLKHQPKFKFPLQIQFFAEDDPEPKPKTDPEVKTVSKELYDKLAGELASLKKANKEKMTDEEKLKNDLTEKDTRIAELEKEINDNKVKNTLLSYGMPTETVEKLVKAGLTEEAAKEIGAMHKQTAEEHAKAIQDIELKKTPSPDGDVNNGGGTITKETFSKMTLDQKIKLKRENETLYNELNK